MRMYLHIVNLPPKQIIPCGVSLLFCFVFEWILAHQLIKTPTWMTEFFHRLAWLAIPSTLNSSEIRRAFSSMIHNLTCEFTTTYYLYNFLKKIPLGQFKQTAKERRKFNGWRARWGKQISIYAWCVQRWSLFYFLFVKICCSFAAAGLRWLWLFLFGKL